MAHTGHPFSNGETVNFSGGASIDGVSLNGNFQVAGVSSNSYTITAGSQIKVGSGGGSSVSVNASDQVTIAHSGHKFAIGDHVTLSNASTVGGLNLNGTFEISDIAEKFIYNYFFPPKALRLLEVAILLVMAIALATIHSLQATVVRM